MTTHHTSLYDDKTNPAPDGVLKQELVTWEETDTGFRLVRLCRSYGLDGHYDSFSSEHILHSGLEVEQAFDIAKGLDELPSPKLRELTPEQERSMARLRKIATGGYRGRDTPYGVKRKD